MADFVGNLVTNVNVVAASLLRGKGAPQGGSVAIRIAER